MDRIYPSVRERVVRLLQRVGGMKDMKDMKGMGDMKGGPHHALAMAYGDNLAKFARALQGQVTHSKTVDLDLARPAKTA